MNYGTFADVITKAALSPQLFKDPECWSGRSRTHDLPHDSPMLTQPTEPLMRGARFSTYLESHCLLSDSQV